MAITKTGFQGGGPDGASTGRGGAFPIGPAGSPGDKTTGAGRGKKVVRRGTGKVAGTPANLVTGDGALGRTIDGAK